MDQLDVLTWSVSGGFVGMMLMIKWLRDDMKSLVGEMKEMNSRINGIDSRLSRVEGMLTNRECCMLQHDHKEKVQ